MTRQTQVSTAYALLVCCSLFWAGNWVVARGLQGHMSPIAMAFWRWFAAFLILLPFVALPVAREWPAIRRSWKTLAVFGVLGVALFNTLTYTGLKYTTATNGALLNSIITVFIIAIGVVFLREQLSARQPMGVALSLPGVLMIIVRGELDALLELKWNVGDLWILGAMLTWSVYTVLLRLRPRELSSRAFTGAVIGVGLIVLVPTFAWDYGQGSRTQWGPATWAAVAYFAI